MVGDGLYKSAEGPHFRGYAHVGLGDRGGVFKMTVVESICRLLYVKGEFHSRLHCICHRGTCPEPMKCMPHVRGSNLNPLVPEICETTQYERDSVLGRRERLGCLH